MNFVIRLLTIVFLLSACTGKQKEVQQKPPEKKVEKPRVDVPEFNPDKAYSYVEAQVNFGPRVPNTPAHENCFRYLRDEMQSFCDTVYVQSAVVKAWNGDKLNMKNIIGSFKPEARTRVLLAAHWDTRPYADHDEDPENHRTPILGANDGGSGVGVLLEIARIIKQNPLNIGVDIILFDAEDYGEPQDVKGANGEYWCLGAQYWSENAHKPFYSARFGILLDMVGVENARFFMEGTSMYFAPDVMRNVWDMAHRAGYHSYFIKQESPPIIDDHLYVNRNRGIPMINIIHHEEKESAGFFEHWHTVDDNMEHVDKMSLKAAGQTVLYVLYHENLLAV